LPQNDKRLFAFVETDGCFYDGVAVASGCWVGHRTLRLMDYRKVAVTIVDTACARDPHSSGPRNRAHALRPTRRMRPIAGTRSWKPTT
jgi:formylmethanofuran dehydrogenase subunit E